ncbi:MAG: ABC transporter permease [Proteocatella sp.]
MTTVFFLFQQTMFFSIPLLIVALGGMFSERGGVVNIALEGIMIIGAFTSIFFIHIMQTTGAMSGQPLLIVAVLVAALAGGLYSLLHAYAAINMSADQVISGTALNMFAPAFAIYTARMIQGLQQVQFSNQFRIPKVPLLGSIPVIGPLFFQNAYITTYIGFAILIVSAFVLYKTKFGLRLRACGEHPGAADSVGINVYRMRYAGVVISGILGGIGGLVFVIPTSINFNADVAGYGFLALAVLIFGQWRPARILVAALFFGAAKTIASTYAIVPFLANSGIPDNIYKMIPYVATLVLLAFTSDKSAAPKAAGQPYDKGAR